jgi:FKBP-type peptidyl-prolyl cis-trans isomerase
MTNMNLLFKSALLFVFCTVCSCMDSQSRQGQQSRSKQIPMETYIEMNRQMVEGDQRIIAEYLENEKLEMVRTQTGMWYKISEPGNGSMVTTGKVVTLNYKIWLLDGTLCYSSDSLGPKVFLVGHGGVESGLEDGVLMLKKGSKATFIMPPHLAHGLIGDDDRIPPRAIIKYEVEVLDVKNKQ